MYRNESFRGHVHSDRKSSKKSLVDQYVKELLFYKKDLKVLNLIGEGITGIYSITYIVHSNIGSSTCMIV